jgi:large-conductance mechanosensitive channel
MEIVSETTNKVMDSIFYRVLDVARNNLVGIMTFLFEKKLIQTAIGLIIATQIGKFTNVLTGVIISPIMQVVSFGQVKKLEDFKIEIFGIEFKLGLLIINLLDFVFVVIIVYYIWKISTLKNFDFIQNFLDAAKPKTVADIKSMKNTNPNLLLNIDSQ